MTDWWMVVATLFAGVLTAAATLGAVIYSNKKTREQIQQEQQKHKEEILKQEKARKYVVLKPTMLINSFLQIADRIILNNDYNRILLFSGKDGFCFYDDENKFNSQIQRLLLIENNSSNDVKNITLHTESKLIVTQTNEELFYVTDNQTGLLRSKESIIIRMLNQDQFDCIIKLNKEKEGSLFSFACIIEYETFAEQKIEYAYEIIIRDDKIVEVIKDGVVMVSDADVESESRATISRNLQDYLCTIDRSQYIWNKMGKAMTQGALPLMQQNSSISECDIS